MADILADISTWSVLKWVVLVLIAGFIGQFGRMLAEAITVRIRLRRARKQPPAEREKEPEEWSPSHSAIPQKEFSEIPSPTEQLSEKPVHSPVPDKKALKALAKARKKEAKKK